jgi:hypothetical protein
MSTPRSIRFDPAVEDRLVAYAARHPGVSTSSVAARLVDEGLRMDEHPGVMFRAGPTGRRACLVGGPEVWEVIRAVRSARAAEPDLGEADILELVSENSGVVTRLVRTAVDYWAAYPTEVDALVELASRAEAERLAAWERTRGLLAQ